MRKISVTVQDRFNQKIFLVDSNGEEFTCPICEGDGLKVWVKKKYIEFNNTFISVPSHCDICNNDFSLNKMR